MKTIYVSSHNVKKSQQAPLPPPPAIPDYASLPANKEKLLFLLSEGPVGAGFLDHLLTQQPTIRFNDAAREIIAEKKRMSEAITIGQTVNRSRRAC